MSDGGPPLPVQDDLVAADAEPAAVEYLERQKFYDAAAAAYLVVRTGEARIRQRDHPQGFRGDVMTGRTTGPTLLELRGVSKTFPGVRALADVRLDLRYDEVLALVGENGAGKSTLMKLLSGIYPIETGEFFLDGNRFEPANPRHAQELGISIIHQEFNLMPDLTVAQNIFIGREPRDGGFFLNERRLNKQAAKLIEQLELPLDPRALVGGLTVAKQQMVEIAKALSYDPRVLIMDEPTAALNEAEVATLHELIRRFRSPPDRCHLHLAPDGRAEGDRGPDHRAARRPVRRHRRHRLDLDEGGHHADGRPDHRQ